MPSLYTVRMFRESRNYSYDETGRRCNERIEKIEVTVTDLPHVTALGYRFKFPKNGVTITRQIGSEHEPVRTTKRDYYERDDTPAPTKSDDLLVAAAIRGDLGAAISSEAA